MGGAVANPGAKLVAQYEGYEPLPGKHLNGKLTLGEKVRDERSLQLLTIDPHAPPEFRANGAAVNHDGFHQAFGTQPGDKMFKPVEERIRIW